jgi:hypothetical protein
VTEPERLHLDDVEASVERLPETSDRGRLDPRDITLIANAVAERLSTEAASRDSLIDAAGVARLVGMDREWVYRHAAELGGKKFGNGRNARWRFDPKVAAGFAGVRHAEPSAPRRRAARRQRSFRTQTGAPLLPIRGQEAHPRNGR